MSTIDQNPSPPLKPTRHLVQPTFYLHDKIGNLQTVNVSEDWASEIPSKRYVADIRVGAKRKMVSGEYRAPIAAIGTGATAHGAALAAIEDWNASRYA